MRKSYHIIRLLTLFCYFLPFIFYLSTCTTPLTSKDAFNSSEAIQNEQERINNLKAGIDSLILKADSSNYKDVLNEIKSNPDFINSDNINYLNKDLKEYLIMPTKYSLSGIGCIFINKTILGQILVCISLGLSLITYILSTYLEKKKITIHIISANIISLLIFIINCIISGIALQFGVWLLLLLLITQLLTERENRISANN